MSEATIPLTPANIWLEAGLGFAAGSSGLGPVKLLLVLEHQRLDGPVTTQTGLVLQNNPDLLPLILRTLPMGQTGPGADWSDWFYLQQRDRQDWRRVRRCEAQVEVIYLMTGTADPVEYFLLLSLT